MSDVASAILFIGGLLAFFKCLSFVDREKRASGGKLDGMATVVLLVGGFLTVLAIMSGGISLIK